MTFVLKYLRRLFQTVAIVCLLAVFAAKLHATSEYDYKRGEFLVIKDGTSPDKKFSIVSGENQKGQFGVYLMDAPTKKIIGRLEEVATDLDTAPDAYYAHWSPDSKHVGISSRSDRHMLENVIYRIENRRAYLVSTPELRCVAVPDFCKLLKELGDVPDRNADDSDSKVRQYQNASEIVKWISPTRFVVSEESQLRIKTGDPTATLGKYGEVEREETDSNKGGAGYYVDFDAEGECELLPGDKSQVVSTHPVKKERRNE